MSLRAIEDIFRRQVVGRNMEAWVPSGFQGHLSMDVSNRYFTPCQHALQDPHISFNPVIDPDNILSQAMGEEFVHTEDNEVEYYEARKEAGKTKWVTNGHYDWTKVDSNYADTMKSTPMLYALVILWKHKYPLKEYNWKETEARWPLYWGQ